MYCTPILRREDKDNDEQEDFDTMRLLKLRHFSTES